MPLSEELRREIDLLVAECHELREALLQALLLVQDRHGFVSDEAATFLAERLKIARTDVDDVLTFYPVFSTRPRGRHVIRVCHTLPCALAGGEAVIDHIAARLGIAEGETTADGRFTLLGVECLGLCEQAPAMMINDTVHGRLTPERIDAILGDLET